MEPFRALRYDAAVEILLEPEKEGRQDADGEGTCKISPNGSLYGRCSPCRSGILEYLDEKGNIVKELRSPETISNWNFLGNLGIAPITLGHPPDLVTPDNYQKYAIGNFLSQIEVPGKRVPDTDTVTMSDGIVKTNFVIHDRAGINAVRKERKDQLSLGLNCLILPEPGIYEGQRYDRQQVEVIPNHGGVVELGRAGAECRIFDDSSSKHQVYYDLTKAKYWQPRIEMTKTEGSAINIADVKHYIKDSLAELVQTEKNTQPSSKEELLEAMEKRLDSYLTNWTKDNRLTSLQERVDSLESELQTAQLSIEEKTQTIQTLNTTRFDEAEVIKRATAIAERGHKLYTDSQAAGITIRLDEAMSNPTAVMRAILQTVAPEHDLDGKSPDYIQAFYDGATLAISDQTRKDSANYHEEILRRSQQGLRQDSAPPKTNKVNMSNVRQSDFESATFT